MYNWGAVYFDCSGLASQLGEAYHQCLASADDSRRRLPFSVVTRPLRLKFHRDAVPRLRVAVSRVKIFFVASRQEVTLHVC